jgi:hypothetical protein
MLSKSGFGLKYKIGDYCYDIRDDINARYLSGYASEAIKDYFISKGIIVENYK